ncbi:DUF3040 domain-containing protein [Lawsonella clevelandensis]|uniref:DUF3040 domain-containing protein n=1 Tax=Lawsonella clevelandensis TaxID=1528099 RepID=A0A0M4MYF9_9ACTN|nr:DUF3040 domain-containing protein [Lawsonella clevelandensis]ALE19431.1 hypothetical protein AL705_07730 [Lawsonella clevelandensis]ALE35105.1 hypothetical protein IY73_07685 [Lawsonella clevelandensis]MDU7194098.1 DUF3040 domain-containing protein [Lawsonella clevelandensis]VHO01624.1 hypothetical protein LC603019_01554 [Lawsonella clevelandensis]
MALSDREQQMLDEIESALTEDVAFTKSVRKVNEAPQDRSVIQGWAIIAVGVVLLFAGFFVKIAGFPLLSLVGFGLMFWGGILLIRHSDQSRGVGRNKASKRAMSTAAKSASRAPGRSKRGGSGNGLADSFQQRFDDRNR